MTFELHKFYRSNDGELHKIVSVTEATRYDNTDQPVRANSLTSRCDYRSFTVEGYFGSYENEFVDTNYYDHCKP